MGRTKGALGKKTLEKMKQNGIETIPVVEPADMFNTPVVEETKGNIEIVNGDPVITVSSVVVKKHRGRPKGSKGSKTKYEQKEKNNFDNDAENDASHNNIENYYRMAIESNTKLNKRLDKETDLRLISAIKNSILCNNINIERFNLKLGGRVVNEDEVMSGEDVKAE
jgi:hypothetical protein